MSLLPNLRIRPAPVGAPRYLAFIAIVLVAAAYVGAAQLGFALAFATQQVTAIWPPTGIAVAVLLIGGWRVWPGILLGAFISNALRDEPLLTAAGIAIGNTLAPVIGAFLLRRFVRLDARFARLSDVFGLALVAPGAMAISAINGVLNLGMSGIIPWSAAPSVWVVWWIGDSMGVLLITPLILTIASASHTSFTLTRRLELSAFMIASVVVTFGVFATALPLAYPVFPVIMWVALRFGQRETACAVLLACATAVWQTIHGDGPFGSGPFDQRLVLLVTFMAVLAVTGLALGALNAERRTALEGLREANDALEARVRARTQELAATNETLSATNATLERRTRELAQKNEEVEAFVYIVSHDLRAPLVNLQGFSRELDLSCKDLERILEQHPLPEAAAGEVQKVVNEGIAGALRYIGASAAKFERLINALLVLSRTGQQTYRIEHVDMNALVQLTLDQFGGVIRTRGASVRVGTLPPTRGDTTALGQVMANLLDNALKYLEPVRAGVIEIGGREEDGQVHYWVRDNGVGVPEHARKRLFQVFQRFHPELAAGDGIGLAAIKRIVERHGGRLWLESELDSGSTFHFTIGVVHAEAVQS